MQHNIFNRIATYLILALVFLLPLFVLPNLPVTIAWSKNILLYSLVLASLVLWLISKYKDEKVSVLLTPLALSSVGIVLVTGISAILSPIHSLSLFGTGEESTTFSFIGISVVLLLLVATLFRTKAKALYMQITVLASALLLGLFLTIRIVTGYKFLSFISSPTFNTLGSWVDVAIFFGLVALICSLALELMPPLPRFVKTILYILTFVSLAFVVLSNFPVLYYVFGGLSLTALILVARLRRKSVPEGTFAKSLPKTFLIMTVVMFVSILLGDRLGAFSQSAFGISILDVRPGWVATFDMFKQIPHKNVITGIGPNTFTYQWLLNKPSDVHNSLFWNTDFDSGIGYIPTAIVATGLLGLLSWVLFLVFFFQKGIGSLLRTGENIVSEYYLASSFFAAAFLWLTHIFFSPGLVITVLTFVVTGLFIAALADQGLAKEKVITFEARPWGKRASKIVVIALIIGTVAWGYVVASHFISHVYLQKASLSIVGGDLNVGEQYLLKSINATQNDAAFRLFASAEITRMGQILNATSTNDEQKSKDFVSSASTAVSAGKAAVAYNEYNYQNWVALGYVYESFVPLKTVTGSYESARDSYLKALSLNRNNPAIFLLLARLEGSHGDYATAKDYVTKALNERNSYTDAIYLLAQIQVAQGDIASAIRSVDQATQINPTDPSVYFQLGLLKYNQKDYLGSSVAFEKAVSLASNYANAKYFLGLSYYYLGKQSQAIAQFQDLSVSNPDNQEVALIIANLTAGRAPFSNAKAPVDNKPEKRKTPPIPETNR